MSHFRTLVLTSILISIALAMLVTGCEPEPLLDDISSDTGYAGESDTAWNEDAWWNQDVSSNDDTEGVDPDDTKIVDNEDTEIPDDNDIDDPEFEYHPDFVVVADILRESCGIAGCHGAAAQGNFAMEGGMEATNLQVRIGLEDVEAINGDMLIEPGDPDQSDIYLRLISDDPLIRMPTGVYQPLTPEKIEAIKSWIESGAPYE